MCYIRTTMAGAFLLLVASTAGAQEAPMLDRDAVLAGIRSIEWLVDSMDDTYRLTRPHIVISRRTRSIELVTGSTGEVVQVRRGTRRIVNFAPEDLQGIERHGLPVTTCDTLSGRSLCGIPEPWLWVIVAAVSLEGDHATVRLESTDLAHGPGGEVEPQGAIYEVVLQRERGTWRVISSKQTGIT